MAEAEADKGENEKAKTRAVVHGSKGIPDGTPVGAIVPQVHGGALRNGGTNKGGPGAPSSQVLHLCAAVGRKGLLEAERLLDSGQLRPFEVAQLAALGLKYSQTTRHTTVTVGARRCVQACLEAAQAWCESEGLSPEQGVRFVRALNASLAEVQGD